MEIEGVFCLEISCLRKNVFLTIVRTFHAEEKRFRSLQQREQVRLVSAKAEHPNHPSRGGVSQPGGSASWGGGPPRQWCRHDSTRPIRLTVALRLKRERLQMVSTMFDSIPSKSGGPQHAGNALQKSLASVLFCVAIQLSTAIQITLSVSLFLCLCVCLSLHVHLSVSVSLLGTSGKPYLQSKESWRTRRQNRKQVITKGWRAALTWNQKLTLRAWLQFPLKQNRSWGQGPMYIWRATRRAHKLECFSFDVAWVQCGHPHSHQQAPFACVVLRVASRVLCGLGPRSCGRFWVRLKNHKVKSELLRPVSKPWTNRGLAHLTKGFEMGLSNTVGHRLPGIWIRTWKAGIQIAQSDLLFHCPRWMPQNCKVLVKKSPQSLILLYCVQVSAKAGGTLVTEACGVWCGVVRRISREKAPIASW